MPSRNALQRFKASFNDIGGQRANLAARKIPFDELELPVHEPAPLPKPEMPAPAEPEPINDNPAPDDLDFSAFLGAGQDDLPDLPAISMPIIDDDSPEGAQSAEDLYAPEGLLSNLSEELDAIPPDFPDDLDADEAFPADSGTGTESSSGAEIPPLDLDSLDNFDLPEEALPERSGTGLDAEAETAFDDLSIFDEPLSADSGDPGSGFLDDIELPAEPAQEEESENIDLSTLDDFILPVEPALDDRGQPEPEQADNSEDIDFGGLDDLGLPEPEQAEEGDNADFGGLDDLGLPEPVQTDNSEDIDFGGLDDLGLPEPEQAEKGDNADFGGLDDLGLPEPEQADNSEDIDFGGLDDLGLPEPEQAEEGDNTDFGGLDDLGLPEPEQAEEGDNADFGGLDDLGLPKPEQADNSEDIDFSGLDDLGLPEPEQAEEGDNADFGGLDDLGLPEPEQTEEESEISLFDETAMVDENENIDLDSLGDFDLPADSKIIDTSEKIDLFDESAKEDEGDSNEPDSDFSMEDFDDLDLPADSESPVEGESDSFENFDDTDFATDSDSTEEGEAFDYDSLNDGDMPDFDIPDDLGLSDEPSSSDGSYDDTSFDGAFDNNVSDTSMADSNALDDFSFPELDNVLKKTQEKQSAAAKPATKKGKGWGRGKQRRPSIESSPDDVEEIQLSDDEFEGLQETLSRYPLNLRIACEEIIAEHAVNPKQMSELIEHLVWGATAKETAIVAGRILGRTISVPKAFQKSSGAALEAEQASFAYIFVHNFLPVLRTLIFIGIVAASLFYLIYKFAYIPHKAESIYQMGYERIFDGEYQRANERFTEAFNILRKKNWFYKYAEAFRDERQYIYAEQKYDELLRYYGRDKKGILDYANLETYYLRNYAKADTLLRNQLLDYAPNDLEGLIAAGDNCLIWGDVESSKYEEARYYYARLLEKYGWKEPIVERMMKYFIRTDNLKEVLPLKVWFDNDPKRSLSAESLGELGGYLLDKKLEETRGVPNEYVEYIDDVRDILLQAVYADQSLPEPHYHLARYYNSLGNSHEERVTLRIAADRFEKAPEGSVRRLNYHIDTLRRYGDVLINDREFIPAEEQLIKGINLYEDAVSRRLISRTPQFGRLYAGLGDLEYFTKTGDMEAALRYYHRSEQNGWAPPEMQYRMGSAYYQLEDWKNALEYLFASSSSLPLNRRVLYAMGNTALKRGDYFAAQGYYNRLLDILESQRSRLPVLLPNDRPEYLELAERLMMARNNAGVAAQMLAEQTGNRSYLTRAMALYAESERAWDARTRDPRSMIRSGSTPLPYLNSRNVLYPQANYEPQIFIRIDREAKEDSPWEELAPLARLE